ncbi:hypothetical protein MTBGP_09590 [Moorella thermoacetica]|uniref:hypothetical protein n=1 Tax=Neomoorella thermoacetica TaxID=1525 RepID=UPI0030CC433E
MLSVAVVQIRKNYRGEVIEENIKIIPDNPSLILEDLGQIFAKAIIGNPHFIKFCEDYKKVDCLSLQGGYLPCLKS